MTDTSYWVILALNLVLFVLGLIAWLPFNIILNGIVSFIMIFVGVVGTYADYVE